jgi:hypothetical protein
VVIEHLAPIKSGRAPSALFSHKWQHHTFLPRSRLFLAACRWPSMVRKGKKQAQHIGVQHHCHLAASTRPLKDWNSEPERGAVNESRYKLFSKEIEAPTRWTCFPTHVSDSTTQVGQDHVATGVLLVLGTNTQTSEPKLTNTHSGNLHGFLPMLHRSDRWPARGQTGDTGQTSGQSRSGRWLPQSHNKRSREPQWLL